LSYQRSCQGSELHVYPIRPSHERPEAPCSRQRAVTRLLRCSPSDPHTTDGEVRDQASRTPNPPAATTLPDVLALLLGIRSPAAVSG